jgi:signal transduction histidine kinase/CheY-like chemotaxis protein
MVRPMLRYFAPVTVLLAAIGLTVFGTAMLRRAGAVGDRERFDRAAQDAQDRIEVRIDAYMEVLQSTAALFATGHSIGPREFSTYVARLDLEHRYPGLQGISFSRRIHRVERAALEEEMHRAGFAEFKIWPDAGREELYPVVYVEPLDRRNRAALGFDTEVEPSRVEAMDRARDTGEPALTSKILLAQEIDEHKQAGFIIYLPVYRGGARPATVAARREQIFGFVASVFRADDLFGGIFGSDANPLVDFRLYDGDPTPVNLLHDRPVHASGGAIAQDVRLDLYGRPWTLRLAAMPALARTSTKPLAPLFLTLGLVLSVVMFLLSRSEARARGRAQEAAASLRRAVEEGERIEARLRDADRRKDEFLAVLGHELRNPLAPIVTALELMRRDPSALPRARAVAERQVRHLVRLVDDLLDVSRITRGKVQLRKERVSVREVVEKAMEATTPLFEGRRQRLEVSLPDRPILLEADVVRLAQVLINLLGNSSRYTPEGGHIFLEAEAKDGEVRLRVRDDGIGFAQEVAERLFEPFEQAAAARNFSSGGLGIGLALVTGLVKLHGGTVSAHSDGPGLGAQFVVRLPEAPAAVEASAPAAPISESAPADSPALQARAQLLIVDDNVDAAEMLAEALQQDGDEVRLARAGPEALAACARFTPDVVLLDIGLPGMTGYEVVGLLRKDPRLSRTLMVALTGFGQESDRARAREAGFDAHLVKPVELEAITRLVRQHLRRSA